jgi:hypothetical protein
VNEPPQAPIQRPPPKKAEMSGTAKTLTTIAVVIGVLGGLGVLGVVVVFGLVAFTCSQ